MAASVLPKPKHNQQRIGSRIHTREYIAEAVIEITRRSSADLRLEVFGRQVGDRAGFSSADCFIKFVIIQLK